MAERAACAGWSSYVDALCVSIKSAGRWRVPRPFTPSQANDGSGRLGDGERVVDFASNDYLGLSRHPAVIEAACDVTARLGSGAGGSRLVTGSRPVHEQLERAVARWKGTEAAVLFPTGFAANLGVLTAFGERGVLVCSDEMNHASIIDGSRLARADVAVYHHRDVEHLDRLARHWPGRVLVVSDLIFSMDGDVAPIAELAQWCRMRGALLVLDEAHAVLGPEIGDALHGVIVVRVGTLSKALGAMGGFAATTRRFAELLVNRARTYVFTTALAPGTAAAALAALQIMTSAEGDALRSRLRRHVDQLAPGHPSPIVPIILGADAAATEASRSLLRQGIWVPAIRPPTVPPDTARLRVTLSATHLDEDVRRLAAAVVELVSLAPSR